MGDKIDLTENIESLLKTDLFSKMERVKGLSATRISEGPLSSFLNFLENLKGGINKDLISIMDNVFAGKSEQEREKIREIIKEKLAEKYKK